MCGSHRVPLNPGQSELLQNFCEDDSYDYPMFPDPPRQDQHVSDIDKCELHVLTGHKRLHLKVNNVTGVLKSSKPYFGWHTQQAVAVTTTFSGTRFLYYICNDSH